MEINSPILPVRLSEGSDTLCTSSGFTKEVRFSNLTGSTVFAKDNNNMTVILEKNDMLTNIRSETAVIIHLRYNFFTLQMARVVHANLKVLLETTDQSVQDPTLGYLYRRLSDIVKNDRVAIRESVEMEIHLDKSRLATNDAILVPQCDFVFSFKSLEKVDHPNSIKGRFSRELENRPKEVGGSFTSIRCIDNSQRHRFRYFYANGRPIRILSETDRSKDDGVYWTVRSASDIGEIVESTTYHTFEEASEHLKIFSTIDEALSNGNPDKLIQLQESELRNKFKQAERELQENKLELERLRQSNEQFIENLRVSKETYDQALAKERQRLEREHLHEINEIKRIADKDRIKAEKKANKLKQKIAKKSAKITSKQQSKTFKKTEERQDRIAKRQDYYEERQYVRRENSDLAKYIPGLVIGGISAIVGTIAIMSSRSKN